ncbi:MAG: 2-hydroxychromene-2-carboxylate isomerase [Pseudomonadota bacterium]
MKQVTFWYDLASTYAFLSAMRIEERALEAGVDVVWQPFLLGPIFKAAGWDTSPFNLHPAKGRYMVRDIERIASARALTFVLPNPFPAHSLQAARLIIAQRDQATRARLSRRVFARQFDGTGFDIADPERLEAAARDVGLTDEDIARAKTDDAKADLRRATETAQALGIFGAPSFTTTDGELFWGDDRLDAALRWAGEIA